ncbi:MAG: hypothetical protein HY359_07905 [Candidatus Rokubacteria bacterium]|nr:hypothetical protein [Candidatus Rokubacteria bacterium]
MKRTLGLVLAGLLGGTLPLGAAREVAAQGRLVVPIIVNRGTPAAAGRTDTRITVDSPQTGGLGAPGAPAAGASVPSASQEIRIITRTTPPAAGPAPAGSGPTRVTIEQVPGSAGLSSPQAGPGFGSVPSYTRETQIRVREGGTTTREIRVQTNGPVDTPIVIVPE